MLVNNSCNFAWMEFCDFFVMDYRCAICAAEG